MNAHDWRPRPVESIELDTNSSTPKGEEDSGEELYAIPLLPEQRRIWRADQEFPGNRAYNAAFRVGLEGALDIGLFKETYEILVQRHEVLRGMCQVVDGKPMLVIRPRLDFVIPLTDLSTLAESEREAEFDRLSTEEARLSFDLVRGPLIRVGLIRLRNDYHVMTISVHHITSDGWSVTTLIDEFVEVYAALQEKRPVALPELPIQFGDYVEWQSARLEQPEIQKQIAYWRRKLDGYQPLEIPLDHPRPEGLSLESTIVSELLPVELTDGLQAFNKQFGCTMYVTAVAAFQLVLHRYTGLSDIGIGTCVAGRGNVDVEPLVGLFLNYLVLRNHVDPSATFRAFAASTRDMALEALANQDAPLESVVEAVRGEEASDRNPFFRINFVTQKEFARANARKTEIMGLKLISMPSKSQGALFDLYFFMVERSTGWRISLEYKTDIISEASARQLLKDMRTVFETIVKAPDTRLRDFAISSRLPVPDLANLPSITVPSAETESKAVQEDIGGASEHADVFPASYSQERFWLLQQASPKSAMLNLPISLRVKGPLARDSLASALSALVARHEILRTHFQLQGANLQQVVVPKLDLELEFGDLKAVPPAELEERLKDAIRAEAGVPFDLERGPLLRARLFQMASDDHALVITLHHSIADGLSLKIIQQELWAFYEAYLDGGSPAMGPLALQYGDFAACEKEWTGSAAATTQLDYWLSKLKAPLPIVDFPLDRAPSNRPAASSGLEHTLLAPNLVAGLRTLSQSVHATMFAMTSAALAIVLARYSAQSEVLFGCPIANRNSDTQDVIGPFAGPMAMRLDLSGDPSLRDLVVLAREETIEALDNTNIPFEMLFERLKVRSVDGRNPLFQFYFTYQIAVTQSRQVGNLSISPLPASGLGTPYEFQLSLLERPEGVSARLEYNSDLFDAETMRGVLEYYVYVLGAILADPEQRLATLKAPIVSSNAVRLDRNAGAASRAPFVAARTDVEKTLVRIWEVLLDRSEIGIKDDFFKLGGQSILVARMVVEIESQLGIKTELSTLAAARTIEQLAKSLSKSGSEGESYLIALQPQGTKPPWFCIHGGGGHILHYRDLASAVSKDQPVYGLYAPELDGARKYFSVESLARIYLRQIRKVQPAGPYHICGYSFGGFVAYELATQLAEDGEKVGMLAVLDTSNWSYYRNMPIEEALRYWTTFTIARMKLYYKRATGGQFRLLFSSVFYFAFKKIRAWFWKFAKSTYRRAHQPLPKSMRDNVLMFGSIARSYMPRPFDGSLLLIRAEGHGPEYDANASLGWDAVALKGVEVRYVSGSHLTFLEKPNVGKVVTEMQNFQARRAET